MVTKPEMKDLPATRRQRWMLYILTKDANYYDRTMTMEQASQEIAAAKKNQMHQAIAKEDNFQHIYNEALESGRKAGTECTPVPMVVQQHTNMLDDTSSVAKEWHVPEGVCGFAWVHISPATASFCKWLLNHKYAGKDSYYGGITIWISDYGQSYERKCAHAGAMAGIIDQHKVELGIKHCYSMSRLD